MKSRVMSWLDIIRDYHKKKHRSTLRIMALDMDEIISRQKELCSAADELGSARKKLNTHKETLQNAWRTDEAKNILYAIDDLMATMRRIERELGDLGHDIVKSGESIHEMQVEEERRTQEAREEAERLKREEERRKAEEERQAKEAEEAEKRRIAEEASKKVEEATKKMMELTKGLFRRK